MPITNLPGVYYNERVTYELTGEGSKIPVFIGKTNNIDHYKLKCYDNDDEIIGEGVVKKINVSGNYVQVEFTSFTDSSYIGRNFFFLVNGIFDGNSLNVLYTDAGTTSANIKASISVLCKTDGSMIKKYASWEDEINQPIDKGGIGVYVDGTDNELLTVIKEFYEESKLVTNADIGVQYIYIIDVGAGTDVNVWLNALTTAKSKSDATVEVYVGAENINNYSLVDFLESAYGSIDVETHDLNLRTGFATKKDATDNELIGLTRESTGIQKSRIGICEYFLFGKTIARICCTPANIEPGYYEYRSVKEGTFLSRTKQEMLNLQNAGIIFNRDEHINGDVYPKMNLCVSTSFAKNQRPADALFHARFNADALLREIFADCYTQIKANESASNIAYLQTRVNKRVNDKVTAEEMVKYDEKTEEGTKLIVNPSDSDPYSIILTGQIQPVKCTIAIEVEATLKL